MRQPYRRTKSLSFVFIWFLGISLNTQTSVADNYQALSAHVAKYGSVDILVSGGWNAVTGDIDSRDLHRAVTGDLNLPHLQEEFAAQMSLNGAKAEQLYSFKFLPFSVLRVDQKGLENVKNYSSNINIWENLQVQAQLTESTNMIGAFDTWNNGATGKGQTIAIIDSGVDATHPMLEDRVVFEACIILFGCQGRKSIHVGTGASMTRTMHGTHVAGIAAGNGNGLKGVAPEANIAAFKVLSESGGGRTIDILVALDMIFQMKVTNRLNISVVNMSLGGGYFPAQCDDHPFHEAAFMLASVGVNVVAASGNEGFVDALAAPACASAITSVGAIDKNWQVAEFSNSSKFLDILAPGVGIVSASLDQNGKHVLETSEGTSMAAPHVAGALAVMRELYPDMSSFDLMELVKGDVVKDIRNDKAFPALQMNGSKNEDKTSQPTEPAPVPQPEESGGTIAITG